MWTLPLLFLFLMDDEYGKIQPFWMEAGFIEELRDEESGPSR